MKKTIALFALLFVVAGPTHVEANCPKLYPGGKKIAVPGTVELCNRFFVTVFDTTRNGNVFSSEVMKRRTKKIVRENDFHTDIRVPNGPTSEDYTNSGYDRGHMTPAASSNTDKQMSDTFLMTNMTPQVPTVNRVAWRNLEAKVRREPFTHIVTGAIYNSPAKTIGKNRVPIPTAIYKIVYPVTGKATAYYVDNIKRATVKTVPIEDIEKQIGINFP